MASVHEAEGDLNEAMDETIRATLADINSRAAPEEQIPVEEPAAEPAPTESPKEEPARDQTGKFVKGQVQRHQPEKTVSAAQAEPSKPKPATVPEPAVAEAKDATDAELKFGDVPIDLARPPSVWKPAAKAAWAALPEDVRREIYRREADFSNSVLRGPMKQNADFGQAVRGVVEPYRGLIESEGGTPEKAIGELLKTAALFRGNNQSAKLNAVFALDQQFNTGLREHFQRSVAAEVARQTGQATPMTQTAPTQDPRVDQLMQSIQAQEAARTEQENNLANSAIEQFVASKNEKGEFKFPFVDNVKKDMTQRTALIRQANPAMAHIEVLQQAYDEAVWANPETRDVLIKQQTAPQVAAAQTAQHAARARAATVGAMPRRGAIPATEPAKSLEETIRETAQGLGMF